MGTPEELDAIAEQLPITAAVNRALLLAAARTNAAKLDLADHTAALRGESFAFGALNAILLQISGRLENEIRAAREQAGLPPGTPLAHQADDIPLPDLPRESMPQPEGGPTPVTTQLFANLHEVYASGGDFAGLVTGMVTALGGAIYALELRIEVVRNAVGVPFAGLPTTVVPED